MITRAYAGVFDVDQNTDHAASVYESPELSVKADLAQKASGLNAYHFFLMVLIML